MSVEVPYGDSLVVKVVHASHHQGSERYGNFRGIQCSCMALMAICWMLLKRIALWKPADLDCMLQKGDDLFKRVNLMRILSVDNLPQSCKIEDVFLNLDYLENEIGEIVFHAYLISISEIVSSCNSEGNGALLFIGGYALVILWGRECFFIFVSHSRDFSGRKVVNGTAVLLKFLSLYHVDDYIKRTYFKGNSNFLYFQIQFVQIKRSKAKHQTIQMSQYQLNYEEWIYKVVQVTHHQVDAKYGESRGMQCSCMTLMSVGWTLLKPISRRRTSDLDNILLNGDLLFKSINKLGYLSIDDMPNILKIKNSFLTIE